MKRRHLVQAIEECRVSSGCASLFGGHRNVNDPAHRDSTLPGTTAPKYQPLHVLRPPSEPPLPNWINDCALSKALTCPAVLVLFQLWQRPERSHTLLWSLPVLTLPR